MIIEYEFSVSSHDHRQYWPSYWISAPLYLRRGFQHLYFLTSFLLAYYFGFLLNFSSFSTVDPFTVLFSVPPFRATVLFAEFRALVVKFPWYLFQGKAFLHRFWRFPNTSFHEGPTFCHIEFSNFITTIGSIWVLPCFIKWLSLPSRIFPFWLESSAWIIRSLFGMQNRSILYWRSLLSLARSW